MWPGTEVSEHSVLLLHQAIKDGVQQWHGLWALPHLVAREPVNQLHHQRLKQLTTHLKNTEIGQMASPDWKKVAGKQGLECVIQSSFCHLPITPVRSSFAYLFHVTPVKSSFAYLFHVTPVKSSFAYLFHVTPVKSGFAYLFHVTPVKSSFAYLVYITPVKSSFAYLFHITPVKSSFAYLFHITSVKSGFAHQFHVTPVKSCFAYLFHITSQGQQGRKELAVQSVHGLTILLPTRLLSASPKHVERQGVEQLTGGHFGLTVTGLPGQLHHTWKEGVWKPQFVMSLCFLLPPTTPTHPLLLFFIWRSSSGTLIRSFFSCKSCFAQNSGPSFL